MIKIYITLFGHDPQITISYEKIFLQYFQEILNLRNVNLLFLENLEEIIHLVINRSYFALSEGNC